MLAADAFGAFQDVGLDDDQAIAHIGQRFRETFLALGGGCSANEVFRRFLGRDPSPDAFLRINGLIGASKKKDIITGNTTIKQSLQETKLIIS